MGGAMLVVVSYCQKVVGLNIGDQVPELNFSSIINYSQNSANTIDFKDRLLILDFMNTGCTGCIAALPRIDRLKQKYNNQVSVFIATSENKQRASNFLIHNPIGKKITLPIIINDTAIEPYFPHKYISHLVWIFKGKVVAITHNDYVTEKNIKQVLKGQPINWPVKRDVLAFDYEQPLFILNSDNIPEFSNPDFIEYTGFTTNLDNISPQYKIFKDSSRKITRIAIVNFSLLQLVLKSMRLPLNYNLSQIITDKSLASQLVNSSTNITRTDWRQKNRICYERVIKGLLSDAEIEQKIKQDLENHFDLRISLKDSTLVALKLIYDSTTQTKPFLQYKNYLTATKDGAINVNAMLYHLNHILFHPLVKGAQGVVYGNYIKIKMGNRQNIDQLNNQLRPYGLKFIKEKIRTELLFIKKK